MRTVIIGGGAAGLMCAAQLGVGEVYIFERNEKPGKKLYITGKGRCNLTNLCEPKDFLENVVTNPKFLMGCINGFTPRDTCEFIEKLGCKLKTERGRRVFPVSDKSSDVIKAFTEALKIKNVKLCTQENVKNVIKNEKGFSVVTDKGRIDCDNVVLACGGVSYPQTGSNGDGYKLAKALGHDIVPPKAALVPLILRESVRALAGLSLKNVSVSVEGVKAGPFFGEMLFTGDGVSGPIILSLSSFLPEDAKGKALCLDLKPALDEETLDRRIVSDFSKVINKQLKNSLSELLPKSLIPYVIDYCAFNGEKPVNLVTKEERRRLVEALKNMRFIIAGKADVSLGIITSGGVDVRGVNPKTMESKLVQGLYFAGEIIDTDALTGGYNLQIAFSTAVSAARAINRTNAEE